MVTINIDGLGSIEVDDSFKNLSPKEQQKTVDEIYNSTQQRDTMVEPQPEGYFAETLGNVPQSAKQFASDIAQPFLSPIETAKSLGELGLGIIQLAIPDEQGSEDVARTVGNYLGQRYGGLENVKNTFREDPVGILGDLSLILTGGAGIAAKTASTAGRVGKIASSTGAVGRAIDPLSVVGKAVSLPVKGASEVAQTVFGGATGVSRIPIEEALKAGREGQTELLQAMRGQIDETQAVDKARVAFDSLRDVRRSEYLQSMDELYGLDAVLNIDPVYKAVAKVTDDFTMPVNRGRQAYSKEIISKLTEIKNLLDDYAIDTTRHNLRGFDMFKRQLDTLWSTDSSGAMVGQVRNAVKKEIMSQYPEYGKIMSRYEDLTRTIENIESELSLGRKVNPATTLRKLQSATRDVAGGGWSARRKIIEGLDPTLIPELSGQALASKSPRGIPSTLAGLGVIADPSFLLGIPATMPRVVGEGAYKIGQAQRLGQQIGQRANPVLSPIMTGARAIRPLQQPFEEQRQGLLNR